MRNGIKRFFEIRHINYPIQIIADIIGIIKLDKNPPE